MKAINSLGAHFKDHISHWFVLGAFTIALFAIANVFSPGATSAQSTPIPTPIGVNHYDPATIITNPPVDGHYTSTHIADKYNRYSNPQGGDVINWSTVIVPHPSANGGRSDVSARCEGGNKVVVTYSGGTKDVTTNNSGGQLSCNAGQTWSAGSGLRCRELPGGSDGTWWYMNLVGELPGHGPGNTNMFSTGEICNPPTCATDGIGGAIYQSAEWACFVPGSICNSGMMTNAFAAISSDPFACVSIWTRSYLPERPEPLFAGDMNIRCRQVTAALPGGYYTTYYNYFIPYADTNNPEPLMTGYSLYSGWRKAYWGNTIQETIDLGVNKDGQVMTQSMSVLEMLEALVRGEKIYTSVHAYQRQHFVDLRQSLINHVTNDPSQLSYYFDRIINYTHEIAAMSQEGQTTPPVAGAPFTGSYTIPTLQGSGGDRTGLTVVENSQIVSNECLPPPPPPTPCQSSWNQNQLGGSSGQLFWYTNGTPREYTPSEAEAASLGICGNMCEVNHFGGIWDNPYIPHCDSTCDGGGVFNADTGTCGPGPQQQCTEAGGIWNNGTQTCSCPTGQVGTWPNCANIVVVNVNVPELQTNHPKEASKTGTFFWTTNNPNAVCTIKDYNNTRIFTTNSSHRYSGNYGNTSIPSGTYLYAVPVSTYNGGFLQEYPPYEAGDYGFKIACAIPGQLELLDTQTYNKSTLIKVFDTSISGTGCTVPLNGTSCNVNLNWSASGVVTGATIVQNWDNGFISNNTSGATTVLVTPSEDNNPVRQFGYNAESARYPQAAQGALWGAGWFNEYGSYDSWKTADLSVGCASSDTVPAVFRNGVCINPRPTSSSITTINPCPINQYGGKNCVGVNHTTATTDNYAAGKIFSCLQNDHGSCYEGQTSTEVNAVNGYATIIENRSIPFHLQTENGASAELYVSVEGKPFGTTVWEPTGQSAYVEAQCGIFNGVLLSPVFANNTNRDFAGCYCPQGYAATSTVAGGPVTSCVQCQNGGLDGGCITVPPTDPENPPTYQCTNGATNPPECNVCNNPLLPDWVGNQCVLNITVTATNSPILPIRSDVILKWSSNGNQCNVQESTSNGWQDMNGATNLQGTNGNFSYTLLASERGELNNLHLAPGGDLGYQVVCLNTSAVILDGDGNPTMPSWAHDASIISVQTFDLKADLALQNDGSYGYLTPSGNGYIGGDTVVRCLDTPTPRNWSLRRASGTFGTNGAPDSIGVYTEVQSGTMGTSSSAEVTGIEFGPNTQDFWSLQLLCSYNYTDNDGEVREATTTTERSVINLGKQPPVMNGTANTGFYVNPARAPANAPAVLSWNVILTPDTNVCKIEASAPAGVTNIGYLEAINDELANDTVALSCNPGSGNACTGDDGGNMTILDALKQVSSEGRSTGIVNLSSIQNLAIPYTTNFTLTCTNTISNDSAQATVVSERFQPGEN